MGIIGGMDALNKFKENKAKKVRMYTDILIKALTGKELDPIENMELCFPTDTEIWLEIIKPFNLKRTVQILSLFVNELKANIEIAEIRDKERPPQQCYDALRIYEIHLNSLLNLIEVGKIDIPDEPGAFGAITDKQHVNIVPTMENRGELVISAFDNSLLLNVYDFCIETGVFLDSTDLAKFMQYANNAQFGYLFILEGTVKSKLKYTISFLSKKTKNDEWYKKAANSIDFEPSDCSGANVPEDWKIKLNKIE